MIWYQIFRDGPEYEAKKQKGTFTPPNITIKDLYDAVPRHLFEKDTCKSLYYIFGHLAVTFAFYYMGCRINLVTSICASSFLGPFFSLRILRPMLWVCYWAWQGMSFAGIWSLGHEAGHNALSPFPTLNSVVGLLLHTFILTPYYSWRVTHQTHHKATNNLERDETFIPPTNQDLKLPNGTIAVRMDYATILEETPGFTLFKMFVRQFFGFQLYLIHNRKGNPKYPPGTSHYKPSSMLFKPHHARGVIASNISILTMLVLLTTYSFKTGSLWAHYILPWLCAHNWMVMVTYLQHSDPTIPYYRKDQWTFARGALATVDRPLFGWAGRFFLHNISTDHVAHHFFASIPFYNLPQVTEAIKPVLGEYYNYDSTPVLHALWRSFTQCRFVESEGDIVFFKNQYGESLMTLADPKRAHK